MNSKSKDLLSLAQQFEQDTEDAEALLLADILRIVAEKNFSKLIGLRDRMVRGEDPNFHPFLVPERVTREDILAIAEKFKHLPVSIHPE